MMEGRSFVQENHWSLSEKKKEGNLHFVLHSSDLHFVFISSCDCNYLMAMWLLSASTVTELQAEACKMNLRVASMKKKKGTRTSVCSKPQKRALPVLSLHRWHAKSTQLPGLLWDNVWKETPLHSRETIKASISQWWAWVPELAWNVPRLLAGWELPSLTVRPAAVAMSYQRDHCEHEYHCLQDIEHSYPLYWLALSRWLSSIRTLKCRLVCHSQTISLKEHIFWTGPLPELTLFSLQFSSTVELQTRNTPGNKHKEKCISAKASVCR